MTIREILTYCLQNRITIYEFCKRTNRDISNIKHKLKIGEEPELYAEYKKKSTAISFAMKREKKRELEAKKEIKVKKEKQTKTTYCPCGCGKSGEECKEYYDKSLLAEFGMHPNQNESSFDRVYMFKFGFGL